MPKGIAAARWLLGTWKEDLALATALPPDRPYLGRATCEITIQLGRSG